VIAAQMQSGIGFAVGRSMRKDITLTDGIVDQSNFPDYDLLRIKDINVIDMHIVA